MTTNSTLDDRVYRREARAAAGSPVMTVGGTLRATAVLFAILTAAGAGGWAFIDPVPGAAKMRLQLASNSQVWVITAVMAVSFVIAMWTIRSPKRARFTSPVYAAGEGFVLGAISHFYEASWKGIVAQAVGLTATVFLVMLGLYATRIIKVTARLARSILIAMVAILAIYIVDILLRVFAGAEVPFLDDSGPIGIAVSVLICGVAAFNLLLDFDFIESSVDHQAPKYMEWYGAFGLMVSLVWLYLEILRLLSKVRD